MRPQPMKSNKSIRSYDEMDAINARKFKGEERKKQRADKAQLRQIING